MSSGFEPDRAARFDVVFVCTGNQFRSPLAAALFRAATPGLPVRVRSLGTQELGPAPVLPEALDWATQHGLDLSEHRAAPVGSVDLSGADLVVGFERSHTGAAILEAKAPPERSFLLAELVELVNPFAETPVVEPVQRARALVAQAHEARLGLAVAGDEVPDPLGGPRRGYGQVAARVQALALDLAHALFGGERTSRAGAED
jgi:protein-tyrosine phosphatase